jgi:hypothetical protein
MSNKNELLDGNATLESEANADNKNSDTAKSIKKFKKSDILVFAICLVVSTVIWAYASNVEKTKEEKELSKEIIQEVVESGMKNNETSAPDESK